MSIGSTEGLTGSIERVTFHNPDNGFAVLRVKAQHVRDLITVVGHLPSATAGEYIEASGQWVVNKDHGQQFRADAMRTTHPATAEGIEKYLGSGFIKGIGPHFAKQLVQTFGRQVFEVIEHEPARRTEVAGIGPTRQERITRSWRDQRIVREIMVFLQGHGVGTARAVRIYKTYGDDAIGLVKQNPYRLATTSTASVSRPPTSWRAGSAHRSRPCVPGTSTRALRWVQTTIIGSPIQERGTRAPDVCAPHCCKLVRTSHKARPSGPTDHPVLILCVILNPKRETE
jgi:hypothetical protein